MIWFWPEISFLPAGTSTSVSPNQIAVLRDAGLAVFSDNGHKYERLGLVASCTALLTCHNPQVLVA
jgi:hypothetical protein